MIRVSSFEELIFPETMVAGAFSLQHRLNMELDLQSLFGFLCTAAVLIGWDPATPPPPHLDSYGRYWSAKIDDISL